MPKVSIIIPVYNVEQYIERCARSLFEQTLDDLEYIFVNDCTPDKSMAVLSRTVEDYPSRKNQVKIINLPVNSGLGKVRRTGIEAAVGDYIIHCDSDDWVEKDMYNRMWEKAESECLDMVICGYSINKGGEEEIINIGFHHSHNIKQAIVSDEIPNYLWNKLVKKDVANKVEIWPVSNLHEDAAIICQITCHCSSIGIIQEPFYHYISNTNSITNLKLSKELIVQMVSNTTIVCNSVKRLCGKETYKKELLHRKCFVKINSFDLPWQDYITVFPEITLSLLFDSYLPISKRLGHITKCLGIHGISKVFNH